MLRYQICDEHRPLTTNKGVRFQVTVLMYICVPLLRKKSNLDGLTMTNLQTYYCKNQLKTFMKPSLKPSFAISFLEALKYDAVRSFLSRCEVLCEDVMDSQEEKTTNGTFILHVI